MPSPPSETQPPITLTSTFTSVAIGVAPPSTVIVTIVTTITPSTLQPSTTITTTQTVLDTTGANPAYRLTLTLSSDDTTTTAVQSSDTTTATAPNSSPTDTASYCPTGFYGCLAKHGGGCCRTDRDCATSSCPPTAYTTIIPGPLVTVAVPVSDLPNSAAAALTSCAAGWYLCGSDAGTLPGCCPSGYACDIASCTATGAGATASPTLQKEVPGSQAALRPPRRLVAVGAAVVALAVSVFAVI